MPAYTPFLLPLAGPSGPSANQAVARSALEEEEILSRRPGLGWEGLRDAVRRRYGLELLIEAKPGWKVRCHRPGTALASPLRTIEISGDEESWFVMEHPLAVPKFDTEGKDGQKPALARPSLFVQLLTTSDHPRERYSGNGLNTPAQGDLRAFHRHLEELLRDRWPSDWHLEATAEGYRSRIRVDGRLRPPVNIPVPKGAWLLNSIRSRCGLENVPLFQPAEGRFLLPLEARPELPVRVSIIPSIRGPSLAARFLYPHGSEDHRLVYLGFTPEQASSAEGSFSHCEGFWLVAGPTGSGKSTTLHAFLHQAAARNEKILAVEDPVERTIPGVLHLQAGSPEGLTFSTALRSFMRQSPDCILVGEIRDQETAEAALQAARSGHRVLSTIHAANTTGIYRRLHDLGQPELRTGLLCRMLIHQRLAPRMCSGCREWISPPEALDGLCQALDCPPIRRIPIARGCRSCLEGTRGRIAIVSIEDWSGRLDTSLQLARAALNHLKDGKISRESLWKILPHGLRSQFPLCQL